MLRHALLAALLTVAVPAPGAHADDKFQLKSVNVDLPFGDRMFPDRAGSDAANNNCLACHSAGMVLTQPALSKEQWRRRSTSAHGLQGADRPQGRRRNRRLSCRP